MRYLRPAGAVVTEALLLASLYDLRARDLYKARPTIQLDRAEWLAGVSAGIREAVAVACDAFGFDANQSRLGGRRLVAELRSYYRHDAPGLHRALTDRAAELDLDTSPVSVGRAEGLRTGRALFTGSSADLDRMAAREPPYPAA